MDDTKTYNPFGGDNESHSEDDAKLAEIGFTKITPLKYQEGKIMLVGNSGMGHSISLEVEAIKAKAMADGIVVIDLNDTHHHCTPALLYLLSLKV